jgi:hypothetical protein
VPVGGGIGQITKVASQPINLSVQFYGNPVHPAGTSSWSLRMQIAFLFPQLSKEQQKKVLQNKLKELDQKSH